MDSIARWALSKMSPEARKRVAMANAALYDSQTAIEDAMDRKLQEERRLKILNESYKIDASKISLEDLDQVKGDWSNDRDVAILWDLGRYLLQKDRDFTNQAEMDILQKYLDIINPKIDQHSSLFPKSKLKEYSNGGHSSLDDQIYGYENFLLNLNIKNEQLSKVLERHPCLSRTVFNVDPNPYKEEALSESYKIDASKISLEDLDQVKGDCGNDRDVAILWALGRYLLQKDRDFTNQAEMDILQKYLDIINPEVRQYSSLFPKSKLKEYSNGGHSSLDDQIYGYVSFLQNLNIKNEQLSKVLEKHPCLTRTVFKAHPNSYTKEQAQKVVEQYMCDFIGFDEEFQQMKRAYVENFGDDFDTIMVDTDNNKGTFCLIEVN